MQFRIVVGDITTWPADGIVNSASPTLLNVSPLDHRLYKAAGLTFFGACSAQRGCHVGDAKILRGYALPARYVIQAVGPYWRGGKRGEEKDLASAYLNALERAKEKHLTYLAFTSLSTEDKQYPRQQAAAVAIPLLLTQGNAFDRIDIVCEHEAIQTAYIKAAIFYYLQNLRDVKRSERKRAIAEAAALLAVLPVSEGAPDPIRLGRTIQTIQDILKKFVTDDNNEAIVVMEQTAARIMAVYSDDAKGEPSHE